MIDSDEKLAALLARVRNADWLAVDTEADSLHAYPEKLCLLQVSLAGRDEVIDPLAKLDLGPLLRTMSQHRLIMHGADYDLRLLHRTYGFVPSSVFDTMLAARLLGYAELGLERLAAKLLGIRLEKGPQRANWARRPLTDRMADYARNDTRHLKPLADQLMAGLEQKGRRRWHDETCARLVEECTAPRAANPDTLWRLGGADKLGGRGLAVLRELWYWRDGEALKAGRPPYFILKHETLVDLAAAAAQSQALDNLLPRRLRPSRRQGVLGSIEKALALPEAEWPHPKQSTARRLTASEKAHYQQLRQQRDRQAKALSIDPSLIASRAMLLALAAGRSDPGQVLMNWQRELLLPQL